MNQSKEDACQTESTHDVLQKQTDKNEDNEQESCKKKRLENGESSSHIENDNPDDRYISLSDKISEWYCEKMNFFTWMPKNCADQLAWRLRKCFVGYENAIRVCRKYSLIHVRGIGYIMAVSPYIDFVFKLNLCIDRNIPDQIKILERRTFLTCCFYLEYSGREKNLFTMDEQQNSSQPDGIIVGKSK